MAFGMQNEYSDTNFVVIFFEYLWIEAILSSTRWHLTDHTIENTIPAAQYGGSVRFEEEKKEEYFVTHSIFSR